MRLKGGHCYDHYLFSDRLQRIAGTLLLAAFFWAQRSGQNDDLYTPGMRMLLDDEEQEEPAKK